MSNLINPVSSRLGSTRLWDSTWAVSNQYLYAYNSVLEQQRSIYIRKMFNFINETLGGVNFSSISLLNFKTISINKTFYLLFYVKLYDLIAHRQKLHNFLFENINFDKGDYGSEEFVDFEFLECPIFYNALNFKKKKYKQKRATPLSSYILQREYKNLPNFYTSTTLARFYDLFLLHTLNIKKIVRKLHFSKVKKFGSLSITIELLKMLVSRKLLHTFKLFFTASVKKMHLSRNLSILKLFFIVVPSHVLTSAFLAQYVVSRLTARYPVRKLVKTLVIQMRRLQSKAQILGVKITCSGRFERRGRASFVWENTGMVGNSTSNVDVDYTMSLVTLTNSICAIKVWVLRNAQPEKITVL